MTRRSALPTKEPIFSFRSPHVRYDIDPFPRANSCTMLRGMKILSLAASLRNDSVNRKLIRVATSLAEKTGHSLHLLDLKDYLMPSYDGDIETVGIPDVVHRFTDQLNAHEALIV